MDVNIGWFIRKTNQKAHLSKNGGAPSPLAIIKGWLKTIIEMQEYRLDMCTTKDS